MATFAAVPVIRLTSICYRPATFPFCNGYALATMRALDTRRIEELEWLKFRLQAQSRREHRWVSRYEHVHEHLRNAVAQLDHAIKVYLDE